MGTYRLLYSLQNVYISQYFQFDPTRSRRISFKMPLPVGGYQQQGPSCFDRMKMGFAMGFCIGMASGAFWRFFSSEVWGPRERINHYCRKNNGSRRWNFWNFHGDWDRTSMLNYF